ncbi:hypothetical protein DBV15_02484 [Temnothorax longispinosus]|uniref:Major facilitator superfamily (MFS) profile domain-containing protein n=1 Tax=Temnothorax longispinosus TaxID=300112 RepID=A0A4S2KTA7_9HYME|nr:hypothetical protein DBV15_02484 [Temnothorax longispinosus]
MYQEYDERRPLIAPPRKRWIPIRIWICMMMFTACWTSYACRLQMPILVVPMIEEPAINHTVSGVCVFNESRRRRDIVINPLDPASYLDQYVLDLVQEERDRKLLHSLQRRQAQPVATRSSDTPLALFSGLPFDWSPTVRGQLLASYAYGNVPGNFIGGWLSLRYGPRRAVLWTSVLAALISLITPILAQCHWGLLLFSRIIIGITGGVTFPACHTMVAKWAPPHERARFIWSLLGGTFGTILTYLMIAGVAETLNWESGWYVVPSLLMLMWVCVWALVAYDSLREHLMGITVEEKDYILTAQAGTIENMMCQYDSLFKSASRYPYISRVPTGEKNLCFVYQFVKNANRYSIGNRDTFHTVNYISGPPTYFPKYGNFPKTFMARKYSYDIAISSWRANVPWDPYTDHVTNINDKGINYIELEFHEHVYPIRVSIYEVYHPGLIIKIWAQDSQNKWFPLWEGSPQILPLSQESRLFSPLLQSCNFKTNRLRLEFSGIAETLNWESGWYIPSLLMLMWVCVWALVAYDSPREHPGITVEEKDYILTAQAGTVRPEKPRWKQTPMREILTSVPFISLIICHFGNLFLLFFYQNSLMLYLTKALGFQLTKGGAAAGAPWGARMLFGFFFSWAGDTIKRKQLITVTLLRKLATIFCKHTMQNGTNCDRSQTVFYSNANDTTHLIPGVFLILVGYVGCDFVLANVFLFLALGFNGAALISNLSNNQDLAPNFAGFLYGIMNTIGSSSGMIIPPIVEEIAGKYGNPIDRWQILFWIGAAVCIGSMVVFLFGGSGNIQKWNELRPLEGPKENVEAGQTNLEPIDNTART